MASYWFQNRCVFRKNNGCVNHAQKSGKVKITLVEVCKCVFPAPVWCGVWLHDIFISSEEHFSCIIVSVFRLIGGLSIRLSVQMVKVQVLKCLMSVNSHQHFWGACWIHNQELRNARWVDYWSPYDGGSKLLQNVTIYQHGASPRKL
jgi:hypothetical protein